MTWFLRSLVAASALLAGCYETPAPECGFACDFGTSETCSAGYTCRPDNLCKRSDVADGFSCPDTPDAIDGAVADGPVIDGPVIDGPVIDGPVTDAPVIDAPVIDAPVIDAPVIDAPAIDAPPIDAPDDASPDA
jgi:hypothetical protein